MSRVHRVRDGECLHSLAKKYGFFPETLWTHSDNSELRNKRKDGAVLKAGDELHVPEKTLSQESAGAQQKHRFRRKGVPAVLRVKFNRRIFNDADDPHSEPAKYGEGSYEDVVEEPQEPTYEPIANEKFVVSGDLDLEGTSDGEGLVELPIMPDARSAKITFFSGTEDEVSFELALGALDPVDTPNGASQRLHNLSFGCPPEADDLNPNLSAALKAFQLEHGLEVSGRLDQETQNKLVAVHGA